MPSHRFTVLPLASCATNVASRDSLIRCARRSSILAPVNPLPRTAPRRPVERLLHSATAHRELHGRRALGAEPALVDWAVGITLDLQELRLALLILLGVRHERATHGAVRAE